MWLEAIISEKDFETVVRDFTPVTIALGEDGELHLEPPTAMALVKGEGLRLTCHVGLRWSVLGIHVPITIESATVLLEIEVAKKETGDVLAFKVKLEALDIGALPKMFAGGAIALINKELETHHAEFVWDFRKTLAARFDLPDVLTPARAMSVNVAWAEVRVSNDALVLALSVHLKREAPLTKALVPISRSAPLLPPVRAPRHTARDLAIGATVAAATASCLGLLVGTALAHRQRGRFLLIRGF